MGPIDESLAASDPSRTTAAIHGTSAIATVVTAAAAAAATAIAAATKPGNGEEQGECRLVGPFAIFIQGALGLLALLSLVFKRWRERPQRPVKVWAFDVSKQVVGSLLLHLANLLMSMLSSGELGASLTSTKPHANPCSFYLLNLAIDTTIGIPILIVLLRLVTYGAALTPFGSPPESIESGNYGDPPKAVWWLKQSLIYFVGLLGMKICVFVIFQVCPWIIHVGDWALRWTEGNEMVQVFFVMLLFPVIMNALQYYIIDGFIKKQRPSEHQPIPSEDDEDEGHDQDAWDASLIGGEDPALANPKQSSALGKKHRSTQDKPDDYDSDLDGDDSPTIIASGSGSGSDAVKDDEEPLIRAKSPTDGSVAK